MKPYHLFMNRLHKVVISLTAIVIPSFCALSQTSNPTMKAIVVQKPGGTETLKLQDVPRPQPKADEILIKVMAAGINPVDAFIRAGRFGGSKSSFTPGMDVAGVIETTGANAKKFKKGDPVYAYLSFDSRNDRLAGADRSGEVAKRSNRFDSWRFGRRRPFCHPNRKGAGRESDCHRVDG
jgi:NADPH:quinone reductase-like Zn-dependent oxidoreductase